MKKNFLKTFTLISVSLLLFMSLLTGLGSAVLDDGFVYAGGYNATDKTIKKYDKSDMSFVGESSQDIIGDRIYDMVQDDTYIYLVTGTVGNIEKYYTSNLTYVGNSSTPTGASIQSIAQDETYLYVGVDGGSGTATVKKYLKSNLNYVSTTASTGKNFIFTIKMDSTNFYIGGNVATTIRKYTKSTMAYVSETPLTGISSIYEIELDDTYIYAAGETKLKKYLKSDMSHVSDSVDVGDKLRTLISDGTYIYASLGNGYPKKFLASNLSVLATADSSPGSGYNIALDSTYVYIGGSTNVEKYLRSDMSFVSESPSYGGTVYGVVTGDEIPPINITSFNNTFTNNLSTSFQVIGNQSVNFSVITDEDISSVDYSCGSGAEGTNGSTSTSAYLNCEFNTVGNTTVNITVTDTYANTDTQLWYIATVAPDMNIVSWNNTHTSNSDLAFTVVNGTEVNFTATSDLNWTTGLVSCGSGDYNGYSRVSDTEVEASCTFNNSELNIVWIQLNNTFGVHDTVYWNVTSVDGINIISYGNNATNNEDLNIELNVTSTVYFNVTSDLTIDYITATSGSENISYGTNNANFTYTFDTIGLESVYLKVYDIYGGFDTVTWNVTRYEEIPLVENVDDGYIYAVGFTSNTTKKYMKSDMSFVSESVTYGTNINSVLEDETFLYYGGATGIINKIYKSNMSLESSIDTGDNIYKIKQDSLYIYSVGGTNGTIEKYLKSNMSFVSESPSTGGTLFDFNIDSIYIYAVNQDNKTIQKFLKSDMSYINSAGSDLSDTIVSDDDYLYIEFHVDGSGSDRINKYLKSDMSFVTNSTLLGDSIGDITSDNEYIYAIASIDGFIEQYYKSNMSLKTTSPYELNYGRSIITDENFVYVAGGDGGTFNNNISKLLKSDLTFVSSSPSYNGVIMEISTGETPYPNIISWSNTYTNNATNDLTVPENTEITFNVTDLLANDYEWYLDEVAQEVDFNNWSRNFILEGFTNNVTVITNNSYGSDSHQWNVTVINNVSYIAPVVSPEFAPLTNSSNSAGLQAGDQENVNWTDGFIQSFHEDNTANPVYVYETFDTSLNLDPSGLFDLFTNVWYETITPTSHYWTTELQSVNGTWVQISNVSTQINENTTVGGYENYSISNLDTSTFRYANGTIKLRYVHPFNGNPNHNLHFDEIKLNLDTAINITSWSNDFTGDDDLSINVEIGETVAFNVTTDKDIDSVVTACQNSTNVTTFVGTTNVIKTCTFNEGGESSINILTEDVTGESSVKILSVTVIPLNITSWQNSYTEDSSTSLSLLGNNSVTFNVTTNNSVDIWGYGCQSGSLSGVSSDSNNLEFTCAVTSESGTPAYITATNTNGISDTIQWSLSVLSINDTTNMNYNRMNHTLEFNSSSGSLAKYAYVYVDNTKLNEVYGLTSQSYQEVSLGSYLPVTDNEIQIKLVEYNTTLGQLSTNYLNDTSTTNYVSSYDRFGYSLESTLREDSNIDGLTTEDIDRLNTIGQQQTFNLRFASAGDSFIIRDEYTNEILYNYIATEPAEVKINYVQQIGRPNLGRYGINKVFIGLEDTSLIGSNDTYKNNETYRVVYSKNDSYVMFNITEIDNDNNDKFSEGAAFDKDSYVAGEDINITWTGNITNIKLYAKAVNTSSSDLYLMQNITLDGSSERGKFNILNTDDVQTQTLYNLGLIQNGLWYVTSSNTDETFSSSAMAYVTVPYAYVPVEPVSGIASLGDLQNGFNLSMMALFLSSLILMFVTIWIVGTHFKNMEYDNGHKNTIVLLLIGLEAFVAMMLNWIPFEVVLVIGILIVLSFVEKRTGGKNEGGLT